MAGSGGREARRSARGRADVVTSKHIVQSKRFGADEGIPRPLEALRTGSFNGRNGQRIATPRSGGGERAGASLPERVRQRVRHRGASGGAARSASNSPQRVAYGLYAEQIVRHRVHRAARREPADLDLPDPSGRGARAVSRIDDGALVGRFGDVATPPNQLRWSPLPLPLAPTDFVEGLFTMAGQRGRRRDERLRDPRVRGQSVDEGSLLLRCRRRTADRAAAGAASPAHRTRRRSTSSRRRSR